MPPRSALLNSDLYDNGRDLNLATTLEATPGGDKRRSSWAPGLTQTVQSACHLKLKVGAIEDWNKSPVERIELEKKAAGQTLESSTSSTKISRCVPPDVTSVSSNYRQDLSNCAPVDQQYQTTPAYVSYVLYMRGVCHRNEQVSFIRRFPSVQAARDFYEAELAPSAYKDGRYQKSFREGGPLEWYNPLGKDWWNVDRECGHYDRNRGLFERLTRELPKDDQ